MMINPLMDGFPAMTVVMQCTCNRFDATVRVYIVLTYHVPKLVMSCLVLPCLVLPLVLTSNFVIFRDVVRLAFPLACKRAVDNGGELFQLSFTEKMWNNAGWVFIGRRREKVYPAEK